MTTDPSKGASPGRWVTRSLAVLAVAAATIAVYAVISGSLSSSNDGQGDQAARSQGQGGGQPKQEVPEAYVVQPGDTLGGIAAKLDVPVGRLERLNPDVDPVALPPGATLRLRR